METNTLLLLLITIKYKGKGNVREKILEMSHIDSKLMALKVEFSDDMLVHLVLLSLPTQYNQFKVSYNTKRINSLLMSSFCLV